jgi:hypothetical protein
MMAFIFYGLKNISNLIFLYKIKYLSTTLNLIILEKTMEIIRTITEKDFNRKSTLEK